VEDAVVDEPIEHRRCPPADATAACVTEAFRCGAYRLGVGRTLLSFDKGSHLWRETVRRN